MLYDRWIRSKLSSLSVLSVVLAAGVLLLPATVGADCAEDEFCVNYDTTTNAKTSSSGSTLSWSHTVSSDGINRAIVVGVSIRKNSGTMPTVSSLTYDGVSLSELDSVTSEGGSLRAEIWGLADDDNVSTGSNTVSVTLSASADSMVGGAVSFTGVDPDSPFDATSARGTTDRYVQNTLAAVATTSYCVDAAAIRGNYSASKYYSDQTERWNDYTGTGGSSDLRGFGSTRPGQGSDPFTDTKMIWDMGSGTSTSWAAAMAEVRPFDSTAARVDSFDATATPSSGVALRWVTGGEKDTLGYRLYRDDEDGRAPVTRSLIAGSALASRATLRAGYSYGWIDPDGRAGDRYWLEEVETDGGTRWFGPFTAAAGPDLPAPDLRSARLTEVTSRTAAASTVTGARDASPALAGVTAVGPRTRKGADLDTQWALAADPDAIKVGVRSAGWYRLTAERLQAYGLAADADPDGLALYADGVQVPIRVVGGEDGTLDRGDAVEFFGVGLDAPYTETRVYWLIEQDAPGLRMSEAPVDRWSADAGVVPAQVELRERLVYVASFSNGDASNFFGVVLVGNEPTDRTLELPAMAPESGPGELRVLLQGFSDGPHEVRAEVNGNYVGTVEMVDQESAEGVFQLPYGMLCEGDNTVRLVPMADGQITLVDTITIRYGRRTVARGDELLVTVPADSVDFRLDGFSAPAVNVVDVTEPFAPRWVRTRPMTPRPTGRAGERHMEHGAAPQQGFAIGLPAAERTVYAFTDDRVLYPPVVERNRPSSWHDAGNGADVVVITARQLRPALDPWIAYRSGQGYDVQVIDVEDVYDEYGFGAKGAAPINDLLARAVTGWETAPEYLLLVGDASYDPRGFLDLGQPDLVPTKFIATDAFEAVSDEWFGDLNGDGISELRVGRLPVRTVDELETIVGKILAYEQAGRAWSDAVLVSDDDMGGQFETSSNRLGALMNGVATEHLRVGQVGDDEAHTEVLRALRRGVDLVNFVGHGGVQFWSGHVLSVDDAAELEATDRPAIFTMMNCMNGYFFDAALESLAEALLVSEGGAVAVWASTAMTGWAAQEPLMASFYEQAFAHRGTLTLGEAASMAKVKASQDVRRTWVVLGDPLTRLR